MSTPEWPVPYWQRSFKEDAAPHEGDSWDPSAFASSVNDRHVIMAKEYLKMYDMGYVVEAVENHMDLGKPAVEGVGKYNYFDSEIYIWEVIVFCIYSYDLGYSSSFVDSTQFTTAYVDDLLDNLNIAVKQNIKLLNSIDLGDCMAE